MLLSVVYINFYAYLWRALYAPRKLYLTNFTLTNFTLKLSLPLLIWGKSMIPNNAANYAANIKDTFIDTRSCAAAKLPSQARARGGAGGEIRIRRGIRIKQKRFEPIKGAIYHWKRVVVLLSNKRSHLTSFYSFHSVVILVQQRGQAASPRHLNGW